MFGCVFDVLKNVRIYVFDMGVLFVGVSVRGEFENCLKLLLIEFNFLDGIVILFIDEVYFFIGVGGFLG